MSAVDSYYAIFEPSTTDHEVIIEGCKVSCNYLFCGYEEEFPTIEDAEVAGGVHQEYYAEETQ